MITLKDQIKLEQDAIRQGVERYFETLGKDREKNREFDGSVGRRLISKAMTDMIPAVRQLQRQCRQKIVRGMTDGERLQGWEAHVYALPAATLAYATIRTILSAGQDFRTPQALGRQLGTLVNLEVRWAAARLQESSKARKEERRNRIELLKRTVKAINPHSVNKWLKRLDDIETEVWSLEVRMRLGANLTHLLVEACPEVFHMEDVKRIYRGRHVTMRKARLTDAAIADLNASHETMADEHPLLVPMIYPPKAWKYDADTRKHVGGYYAIPKDIIKRGRWAHSAALSHGGVIPTKVMVALNVVSQTAWKINQRVLLVAEVCHHQGIEELLPVAPPRDLPTNVSAEEWDALSPKARGKIKQARREVHDHNNKLEAKRGALRRQLSVAREFAGYPEIYFPHNLDFRGRAYPLPQDLHPQADDFGKSLLTFAEAKPLGHDGLRWLMFHVANTYGMDKCSRDQQMDWIGANFPELATVSRDPLGAGMKTLLEADEPWQFLAACIELEAALSNPHPDQYMSSLPIHVDGSCNGLQHLSAMGRDPIGAHATNLTADPVRQDIYQIVADKVAAAVHEDAGQLIVDPDRARDPAWCWSGHVTRKVVKRGVMTTPYGLTDIGMRDQLLSDGWCDPLEGDKQLNATYLRDRMQEAITGTVEAATTTMAWMQDNAVILAKNNKAVDWRTPSGFIVRQAYNQMTMKRVRTLVGVADYKEGTHRLNIWEEQKGDLQVRRQKLAIAPNIIHSFDAAHMMLTIVEAGKLGVDSVAVVHDSFGTHACDMGKLSVALRTEFVKIYEQDWFAEIQADFQTSVGPDVPLIAPPKMGTFDVNEVLKAEFFFA